MRGLRILAGALIVSSLSCVSYDFEPVDPYALSVEHPVFQKVGRIPANVMLVIDKSGSMDLPMNPSDPACGSCGQTKASLCNATTCPTRWSELQSAMNAVLPTSNGVSRFGLVTYPSDSVCGSPGTIRVSIPMNDDAAALQSNANSINAIIQGITSAGVSGTANTTGGGTPTARALQLLQIDPAFAADEPARADLAILLTDGLPNCNASNPNSWTTNPAACRCTLGTDCSAYPREGCLDDTGTLASVQNLRARGIRTVVIGFGAEVSSGPGPDVLRAIAQAGGFQRECSTASECAVGDTCDGKVCSSGLFLPNNRAELVAFLKKVSQGPGPCDAPIGSEGVNPELVEVKVGDRILGDNEWTLAGSTITVQGAACDQLTNATQDKPLALSVWILRNVP